MKAIALEKLAYDNTAGFRERKYEYATLVQQLTAMLRRAIGPHPNDVAALCILRGELSLPAAIERAPTSTDPDSRDVIRRTFAATLMRAANAYRDDRTRVLADAHAIEQSCYNAVVRTSKQSEDPPRRQWDSPAFVDMYSARCGKIDIQLDPTSSTCNAYGATIVPRLLDGTLQACDIGDATSFELCPAATVAERAEIAKRSEQKVKGKVSNLFKCPRVQCGARESVYQEVHTRGLDEAADYFCKCIPCGFRFKGSN
jgi:DNA-directed RNA polymerase subunit M/transcription elongation factor TFIIS